jgi:nitrate reductase gamma subunit
MSERKLLALAVFAAGMALPGIPILAWLWDIGAAKEFFAIVGAVVAAFAIGLVVRLVNRLGDPRLAKRPPDAP